MSPNDTIPFWSHIHGGSSHFPIAMMFVSLVFDFGSLIFKRPHWRIVAFWTLIVAAVLCVPTILSGLTGMLGWFHVDPYMATPSKTLLLHRNIALVAGGVIIVMAIWRVVSIERKHAARLARTAALSDDDLAEPRAEFAAYLVVLVLATAAVAYAGYLGAYVAQG